MSGADDQAAENRHHRRLPILGELSGDVMISQPMSVTEISNHGVQILTTFPLQLESLHDIRLPLLEQPLVTKCRVVHCAIVDVDQEVVRYRVGLEFVQYDGRLDEAIRGYISRISEERSGE